MPVDISGGAFSDDVMRLRAEVVADTSQAESALDRFQGKARSSFGVLATAGVVAFAALTTEATKFIRESINVAGRAQEMGVVLGVLGKNAGVSQTEINKQVQGIRDLHIELGTAQNTVASFIRYQLDATKATQLARVAQDAAVLGMANSSDELDNIIYGIQTYNTRVLRTAGLNIDVSQAFDKMAKSMGVNVSSLGETARQQAVLNAVLEQGKAISGAYEAAITTPSKALRSLKTDVNDLSVTIGNTALPMFKSFVTFIRETVQNFDKAIQTTPQFQKIFSDAFNRIGRDIDTLHSITNKFFANGIPGLAKTITDVQGFVKQVQPAISVITALFGAFAAQRGLEGIPFFGRIAADINPLMAGFLALVLRSKDVQKALLDTFSKVKDTVGPAIKEILPLFNDVLKQVASLVASLLPKIGDIASSLVKSVVPVIEALLRSVLAVLPAITEVVKAFAGFFALVASNKFIVDLLIAMFAVHKIAQFRTELLLTADKFMTWVYNSQVAGAAMGTWSKAMAFGTAGLAGLTFGLSMASQQMENATKHGKELADSFFKNFTADDAAKSADQINAAISKYNEMGKDLKDKAGGWATNIRDIGQKLNPFDRNTIADTKAGRLALEAEIKQYTADLKAENRNIAAVMANTGWDRSSVIKAAAEQGLSLTATGKSATYLRAALTTLYNTEKQLADIQTDVAAKFGLTTLQLDAMKAKTDEITKSVKNYFHGTQAEVDAATKVYKTALTSMTDATTALAKAMEHATADQLTSALYDVADATDAVVRAQIRKRAADKAVANAMVDGKADYDVLLSAQLDQQEATRGVTRAQIGVRDSQKALADTQKKGTEQDQAVIDARKQVKTATDAVTVAHTELETAMKKFKPTMQDITDEFKKQWTEAGRLAGIDSQVDQAIQNLAKSPWAQVSGLAAGLAASLNAVADAAARLGTPGFKAVKPGDADFGVILNPLGSSTQGASGSGFGFRQFKTGVTSPAAPAVTVTVPRTVVRQDAVSVVPPGYYTGFNATGGPETLVNAGLLHTHQLQPSAALSGANGGTLGGITDERLRQILDSVLAKAKPDVKIDQTFMEKQDPDHMAKALSWELA